MIRIRIVSCANVCSIRGSGIVTIEGNFVEIHIGNEPEFIVI